MNKLPSSWDNSPKGGLIPDVAYRLHNLYAKDLSLEDVFASH